MHTFEPSTVRPDTDPEVGKMLIPKRGSEKVHDFGNTPQTLHILLSSCSDTWNTMLVGSEVSTRIYTYFEHRTGKWDLVTHVIQVLNEPRQILIVQVLNSVLVLVPTKEVDELALKLRRSPIEVAELL